MRSRLRHGPCSWMRIAMTSSHCRTCCSATLEGGWGEPNVIVVNGRLQEAQLASPHGGVLVDLIAPPERRQELKAASKTWPSWDLTARQLCDLELLLNGGFSPLRGFLGARDYESVVQRMRLADGTLWPMPVTLDVSSELASRLRPGSPLALRDHEGVMLAALHVEDVWQPDLEVEAEATFGTLDPMHPGV